MKFSKEVRWTFKEIGRTQADLLGLAGGHILFRQGKFVRLSLRGSGEQNFVPPESSADVSEADFA